MRFHTTLELDGKTATGLTVPDDIIEQMHAGKRPQVDVTVNGYRFQTTVGVLHGRYKIPVSGERRQAAHIAAGDEVDVDIAPAP
ncbi:MAG TPA: DUF1905 domain-containing protein [Thermoleophilia bacterium]|nr:DUF1905 domain-containing protein [Thermoleophilia bacterium]